MSLFQCDKCGCVENTACSTGYLLRYLITKEKNKEVYESYKKVLGLTEEEEFGKYCYVCNPLWFNGEAQLGIGLNPNQREWHNRFERVFLPKGEWITNSKGNLQHKVTGEEDYYKYVIKGEN